jgi:hypothetical protein
MHPEELQLMMIGISDLLGILMQFLVKVSGMTVSEKKISALLMFSDF